MAKIIINLAGKTWIHDDWMLEWGSDPQNGLIEIPLSNDETRWISIALRSASKIRDILYTSDVEVENSNMWINLPETVRDKLAQAGLPGADTLVLTSQGMLGRVSNDTLTKEWQDTKLEGFPSLDYRKISFLEKEIFDEMIHTYLQGDHIQLQDVRIFLGMLWEKSHPDDTTFMGLSGDERAVWSMRWLRRLVKEKRISRALAFRVLEDIS